MNKIDEQYFETINIQTIRYSAFASANTLEILIENETYAEERRRKIQQILIIVVCCIVFNAINCMHSIFIVLNTIILIIIATQSYILANLIKFGKHRMQCIAFSGFSTLLFHFCFIAEKLCTINGLSLQYTTQYFFGTKHIYLPIECIHDIVINEVIFGVSVSIHSIPVRMLIHFTWNLSNVLYSFGPFTFYKY